MFEDSGWLAPSARSDSRDPWGAQGRELPDLSSARLSRPTRRPGDRVPDPPLLMVIDDSPAIRTIVEHTFARVGVQVVGFADGLAAIATLAGGGARVPDLVLLDIDLPGLDGYEVAAVLRTSLAFAEVPIVMLSGRDGPLDRVRSKIAGAHTFLAKPFRTRELVEVVGEQLGIPLG